LAELSLSLSLSPLPSCLSNVNCTVIVHPAFSSNQNTLYHRFSADTLSQNKVSCVQTAHSLSTAQHSTARCQFYSHHHYCSTQRVSCASMLKPATRTTCFSHRIIEIKAVSLDLYYDRFCVAFVNGAPERHVHAARCCSQCSPLQNWKMLFPVQSFTELEDVVPSAVLYRIGRCCSQCSPLQNWKHDFIIAFSKVLLFAPDRGRSCQHLVFLCMSVSSLFPSSVAVSKTLTLNLLAPTTVGALINP